MDYYANNFDDLDYVWFKKIYSLSLPDGWSVKFAPIIQRDNSCTFKFKVNDSRGVSSYVIKLDFSLQEGFKLYDVTSLTDYLVSKLNLCNNLIDRRPKDKVNLCVLLKYLAPKNISKKVFLEDLKNPINLNWLSEEKVTSAYMSVKKFKPKDASGFC